MYEARPDLQGLHADNGGRHEDEDEAPGEIEEGGEAGEVRSTSEER